MATVYQHFSDDYLTAEIVLQIFSSIDSSKLSTAVPSHPKHGEIYIYEANEHSSWEDYRPWKTRWRNLRKRKIPKGCPTLQMTTFQLKNKLEKVDFFRHEYCSLNATLKPFGSWTYPYILVMYKGSFDYIKAKSSKHGNTKDTPQKTASKRMHDTTPNSYSPNKIPVQRLFSSTTTPEKRATVCFPKSDSPDSKQENMEDINELPVQVVCEYSTNSDSDDFASIQDPKAYVKTSREALSILNKKLSSNPQAGPSNVYREAVQETFGTNSAPRNKRQAYYIAEKIKKQCTPEDDLYAAFLFARAYPDVVHDYVLANPNSSGLVLTMSHPGVIKHIKEIIKFNTSYLEFHYDTTFSVGPYFTTILTLKHPNIKGEPLIPVSFMFHERTATKAHNIFLSTNTNLIPGINSEKIIVVTDREQSITKALKECVPQAHNLFCWNHIRRNVHDWCRGKYDNDNISEIKKDISDLLHTQTEKEFSETLNTKKVKWDLAFTSYYQSCLNNDIAANRRGIIEVYGCYSVNSGITNNPAESMNSAVGVVLNHKESSFNAGIHSLYLYQTRLLMEISRCLDNLGDWRLKNDAPKFSKLENLEDIVDPNDLYTILVKGKSAVEKKVSQNISQSSLKTEEGLAELWINKDRVDFIPKKGICVVKGLKGNHYVVNLEQRSCTCLRTGLCSHIIAALKSNGLYRSNHYKKPVYNRGNLGSLYRKTAAKTTGKKRGQNARPKKALSTYRKTTANGLKRKQMATIPITSIGNQHKHAIEENGHNISTSEENNGLANDFLKGNDIYQNECLMLSKKTPNEVELTTNVSLSMHNNPDYQGPILRPQNAKTVIFKLGKYQLTLLDIKSVQLESQLTRSELKFLLKLSLRTSWITDAVIDSFLYRTVDHETIVACPIDLCSKIKDGNYAEEFCNDWTVVEKILFPISDNDHRMLLLADIITTTFTLFNCLESQTTQRTNFQNFKSFVNLHTMKNQDFSIKEDCVVQQKYECDSNVSLCYIAESIVKKNAFNSDIDLDSYRGNILKVIFGDCEPLTTEKGKLKNCKICKKPRDRNSDFGTKCTMCGGYLHQYCIIDKAICKSSLLKLPFIEGL